MSASPPPKGPMSGVRVIDLTTVMFGPYCTQILGEMGADVMKVEGPEGDISRQVGDNRHPSMSAAFMVKGRNKRSVVLDLKNDAARQALYKLCETADVFIHNMRPKAAARLGIAYEDIVKARPDIVYCNAIGFGPTGPYADKPAYDDLIQGLSGLAALTGKVTGEPRYAPSVLADKTSGLFALYSICMGLFHRERTGEGQRIDVPMFETFSSFIINEHMQGRFFEPPVGEAGYVRLLSPYRRPHKTADGYICMMPYSTKHWLAFFELAGRPDLAADERFHTMPGRTQNIGELYRHLAEIMPTRTTAEWLEVLEKADVPSAPMNTPEDLFHDPHLTAVGMFPVDEHPSEGTVRHIKVPVTFSKTPGGLTRHAPRLGEHSEEILREAGLSDADIQALIAAGASSQAGPAPGKG
ncbi:MAG: CoA transferase [Alphaproteobacteria bacterium]|nr:CoA transferase [Alphaproteobacteria bacterium]MCB9928789.1 CoA transferase [Alphaproteobacteria bacterium]